MLKIEKNRKLVYLLDGNIRKDNFKMISIVVPVYNAEKYLRKCIDSILAQTYPQWELVLVDNGSTDKSYEICKEYAQKDVRIRAIHQHRNQGVSVARNLGMEKCTGEFITFIDSDDWIQENYLEVMLKMQKDLSAQMVVCIYKRVYDKDREEKNISKPAIERYSVKVYNVKQYLNYHLLEGNCHCWGVLYQSSLVQQMKFQSGLTIGEDLLFLLEAALKSKKIVVSEYPGYQYYINFTGAMLKKFNPTFMDQITCWKMAHKKIVTMYPELRIKVESILVVSVLLVVGKLAELDAKEQKNYVREKKECYQIFMQYAKKKEIRTHLPKGYPLKVFLYRNFPKGYIFLYGKLRRLLR